MEETNDIRIGLYLSGEMKGAEREQFERELSANSALKTEFAAAERIWHMSASPADEGTWNTDAAWNRFVAQAPNVQKKARTVRRSFYWAAAATFAILAGIYSFFFAGPQPVTYAYAEGMIQPVELTDGSKVYLNDGAEIKVYPFTNHKRHLSLIGEAFMEVEPDTDRPFTVSSKGTLTEVIGTSFNIRPMGEKTQIFVKSGKVIFSEEENADNAVALTQGEAAEFNQKKMEMIPNPSPNIISWQSGKLHFDKQMPLKSIITDIAEYFDTTITVENESTRACRITMPLSIENPEIKSLLEIVTTSISAELIEEDGTYIIRGGKSCL